MSRKRRGGAALAVNQTIGPGEILAGHTQKRALCVWQCLACFTRHGASPLAGLAKRDLRHTDR